MLLESVLLHRIEESHVWNVPNTSWQQYRLNGSILSCRHRQMAAVQCAISAWKVPSCTEIGWEWMHGFRQFPSETLVNHPISVCFRHGDMLQFRVLFFLQTHPTSRWPYAVPALCRPKDAQQTLEGAVHELPEDAEALWIVLFHDMTWNYIALHSSTLHYITCITLPVLYKHVWHDITWHDVYIYIIYYTYFVGNIISSYILWYHVVSLSYQNISKSNVLSNYQILLGSIFSLGKLTWLITSATPDVAEAPQHLRAAERFQRAASMPSALGLDAWCFWSVFSVLEATICRVSQAGKSPMLSGRSPLRSPKIAVNVFTFFVRFLLMCYLLGLVFVREAMLWCGAVTYDDCSIVWMKTIEQNIKNNDKYWLVEDSLKCAMRKKISWKWCWWLTAPLRTRCSSVLRHRQLRRCAPTELFKMLAEIAVVTPAAKCCAHMCPLCFAKSGMT